MTKEKTNELHLTLSVVDKQHQPEDKPIEFSDEQQIFNRQKDE